jgi:DNA-binding transcriptional ArsR family regulator
MVTSGVETQLGSAARTPQGAARLTRPAPGRIIRWDSKYRPGPGESPRGGPALNVVFKALADPTRREILRLLTRGERSAGELAERFDLAKPSMSHHFAVLKEADLVRIRREGQQIFYALNTTVVQDVVAWAMGLVGHDGDHDERGAAPGEAR